MTVTLYYLLVRDRMLMSRLGLAIASALWSIQLFMPSSIFPPAEMIASGKGRQTYALMATIAPEHHGPRSLPSIPCLPFTPSSPGCATRSHWPLTGFSGASSGHRRPSLATPPIGPRGLPFLDSLAAYPTPAAMSADLVMAFYAWWHMVRFWAEEESHVEACALNTNKNLSE